MPERNVLLSGDHDPINVSLSEFQYLPFGRQIIILIIVKQIFSKYVFYLIIYGK